MMSSLPNFSTVKSTSPSTVACLAASPAKNAVRSPAPISSRAFCALGRVATVDHDRRALGQKCLGDAAADRAGAARDGGDFSFELSQWNLPCQYGDVPPSIEMSEPVMPAPASEASSMATAATSSTAISRLVADSSTKYSSSCS